jgi:hypothetical protein
MSAHQRSSNRRGGEASGAAEPQVRASANGMISCRVMLPTAVHTVGDVHETSLNAPMPIRGVALRATLQLVPFQVSRS